MLNSSTSISSVDIYKNVPTEIDKNIPVIRSPSSLRSQPITIPSGLKHA